MIGNLFPLKTILDLFPFPAWHADTDLRRDYFNKVWLELTGRSLNQEVGQGWVQDIYDEDVRRYLETYENSVKNRLPYKIEFRLKQVGGGYRWFTETGTPLLIDSNFNGYLGILHDITGLKRLSNQIDSIFSRSRIMGDHLPLPLIAIDREARIMSWNSAAQNRLGYGLFEVIGRSVRMLAPDSEQTVILGRLAELFDTLLQEGVSTGKFRSKFLTRDGSEIEVLVHFNGIRTEDGPTVFMILTDLVTEDQEHSRVISENRILKSMFEASPLPLIELSSSGEILMLSSSAASFFGEDREKLQGAKFEDLFASEQRSYVNEDIRSVLERGSPLTVERKVVGPNHNPKNVRFSFVPIIGEGMVRDRVLLCIDDVSGREREDQLRAEVSRLQSELETKRKELEDLRASIAEAERLMTAGMAVAQAAHDVRNPLTAIDLGLYALENISPEKEKDEYEKIISTMRSAIKQANEVISDLSQYVKPRPSRRSPIKVRDLIKDSLKTLTIPENIRVDEEMIEPSLVVYGDRAELTRVFQNLAKNAVEAMKEGGGTLKFWSEQREGYTCICITDTGKGMDADTLKRLFTPFFTTKEHGFGLGLTVVKRFVEDHGGKVEAESVPGKGTTFKVLLPVQVQQAKPERVQRHSSEQAQSS